ncbi:MAG: transketolase [Candidatus Beckwithbacteria bacterium]
MKGITLLYFSTLNVYPQKPNNPKRDRFVLSKGHGCSALYSVLYRKGFISKETLYTYHLNDTTLAAHPEIHTPGVDASTGSLGHGLSVASGMALAGKINKCTYKVYAILSDGECDEGSTWEAALVTSHQKLNNLTIIIDYNKIQAFGRTNQVVNLEPFKQKWQSFGWRVLEVDGHSIKELHQALNTPLTKNKPTVIIAHTVLGKGVSFMEDDLEWHYWNPSDEHLKQGLKELRGNL